MERFEEGLRCQDVHAGLRNLDTNSAPITQHLETTQVVGMAATLAAAIRGEDVIGDAQALKVIAADQLDINGFAYPQVVRLLDERGLVGNVKTDAQGRIVAFTENVPFHQDLYSSMGGAWEDSRPDAVATGIVEVVDVLARGPILQEEVEDTLGLSRAEAATVLNVGQASELVKVFASPDGEILYSPFHAFENPQHLVSIFASHGSDRVRSELATLQNYQGLPVSAETPVLLDAVGRGLLTSPSIKRPDGVLQPFAFLPYSIDQQFLTIKKSILDKAISILACVRCGQHFGGVTSIRSPVAILNKLQRGEALRSHSSAIRQYEVLYRMRVVEYLHGGYGASVRLVDTEDNKAAVTLAIELLRYGQPMTDRGGADAARHLLAQNGPYLAPMQTIRDRRGKVGISDSELRPVIEAMLMGRDPIQ